MSNMDRAWLHKMFLDTQLCGSCHYKKKVIKYHTFCSDWFWQKYVHSCTLKMAFKVICKVWDQCIAAIYQQLDYLYIHHNLKPIALLHWCCAWSWLHPKTYSAVSWLDRPPFQLSKVILYCRSQKSPVRQSVFICRNSWNVDFHWLCAYSGWIVALEFGTSW